MESKVSDAATYDGGAPAQRTAHVEQINSRGKKSVTRDGWDD